MPEFQLSIETQPPEIYHIFGRAMPYGANYTSYWMIIHFMLCVIDDISTSMNSVTKNTYKTIYWTAISVTNVQNSWRLSDYRVKWPPSWI